MACQDRIPKQSRSRRSCASWSFFAHRRFDRLTDGWIYKKGRDGKVGNIILTTTSIRLPFPDPKSTLRTQSLRPPHLNRPQCTSPPSSPPPSSPPPPPPWLHQLSSAIPPEWRLLSVLTGLSATHNAVAGSSSTQLVMIAPIFLRSSTHPMISFHCANHRESVLRAANHLLRVRTCYAKSLLWIVRRAQHFLRFRLWQPCTAKKGDHLPRFKKLLSVLVSEMKRFSKIDQARFKRMENIDSTRELCYIHSQSC